jgi:rare lipoprotein A
VLSGAEVEPGIRAYTIRGEQYYSLPEAEGFVQVGKASWYGKKFHGRPTSSGEIYDMYRKTAAHKTLPLGTYVSVRNISNNRETIVRINDRGPFVKGRVIDLSYAAAEEIGSVKPGVVDVKVVALGRKVGEQRTPWGIKPVVETRDLKRGGFTVQVGAFKNQANALSLADRLRVLFDFVEVSIHNDGALGTLYRVRVSKSDTLEEAARVERRLEGMGFGGAFVISI